MTIVLGRPRCWILLVTFLLSPPSHLLSGAADETAAAGAAATADQQVGAIAGTVIYQADPKRPWRYARYYINNRKQGQLAEAVVAIKSRTLAEQRRRTDPETFVIDQKDFRFIPETVAIQAGDQIKFTNSDKQVHNVQTVHPKQSFNTNMPPGGEYRVSFTQASNIRRPYVIGCVYHSSMRAWIFVLDHPYFAVTQAAGRFRLNDVPAGQYDLEMVHPAGQLRWTKTVNVEPNETTQIDIHVSPDDQRSKQP